MSNETAVKIFHYESDYCFKNNDIYDANNSFQLNKLISETNRKQQEVFRERRHFYFCDL